MRKRRWRWKWKSRWRVEKMEIKKEQRGRGRVDMNALHRHDKPWQGIASWCGVVWCGVVSYGVMSCYVAHSQSLQPFFITYWNLLFSLNSSAFRTNLSLISYISILIKSLYNTDHFLNYCFLVLFLTSQSHSSPKKACKFYKISLGKMYLLSRASIFLRRYSRWSI